MMRKLRLVYLTIRMAYMMSGCSMELIMGIGTGAIVVHIVRCNSWHLNMAVLLVVLTKMASETTAL